MATTTSTSRLAIVVIATTLAMGASLATAQEAERGFRRRNGAAGLPSLPSLSSLPSPRLPGLPSLPLLPPLPSVPQLVSHLLRPLAPLLQVAPLVWGDGELCGPRVRTRGEDRRFAGAGEWRRYGWYGEHTGRLEYRQLPPPPYRGPQLLRPQRPSLRDAPRAWSDREVYGSRRHPRDEGRRLAAPAERRRSDWQSGRRPDGQYGDRRR
jgi:hypothetical protein